MTTDLATTSPTSIAIKPTDPRDLLEVFLGSKGNPNTRDAYRRDLERYFAFIEAQGAAVLSAPAPLVDLYARTLESEGLSPATIARRLSAISSYYAYAMRPQGEQQRRFIAYNPAAYTERPSVSDDSPTLGLELDELARLQITAEADSPQKAVMIGLLGELGLRVSAVCNAKAEDLTTEAGHRAITTLGKGGKVTRRRLPDDLADSMEALLEGRTEGVILLRPRSGKPFDRFEVARIVSNLAAKAGIAKRITPHSLRHTHATQALTAGVPLADVSVALGHSDPRTTMRYDRARGALDRDPTHTLEAKLEAARAVERESRSPLEA